MSNILIVEDEQAIRRALCATLRRSGHDVTEAGTLREAEATLDREIFELAIVDLRLPDGDGLALLDGIAERKTGAVAIVMTAYGSVDIAVRAMHAGAFDFLEKPVSAERFNVTVERALEHARLCSELRRRSSAGRDAIVGDSQVVRDLRQRVRQAAEARIVLVTGETGTGKNHVARAIHAERDPTSPFVTVHGAMLPATMLDSELFGHVQGAYPGADFRRGLLREAAGGTAFFDEITTLPPTVQPKLLRFLEVGEIRPGGADRTIHVECQVVAATSHDLAAEVSAGRMRDDFLYRLDVFRIALPPLRDRKEDIPRLGGHLTARLAKRLHRTPPRLDPEAVRLLQAHDWPGNVRELEHTLERAILLSDDGVLTPELFGSLGAPSLPRGPDDESELRPLADVEREHILRVLERVGGDRARTAAILGISRSTLRRKLIAYDRWSSTTDATG